MYMKKVLAIFASCCILFALAACNGASENETLPAADSETTIAEESEVWLPFGLQFGQSYDAFAETIEAQGLEAPALRPANSNSGYLTEHIHLLSSEAETYLGYEVFPAADAHDIIDDTCGFGFSFNQNEELYEWYWTNDALFRDADDVVQSMISTYNEKFGFDGTVNDGTGICAEWMTESLAAQIVLDQDENGNALVTLIFHSFEYDLNR